MSRSQITTGTQRHSFAVHFACGLLAVPLIAIGLAFPTAMAHAAVLSPMTRSWCSANGSQFMAWTGTSPDLPICGPGPDYGGGWSIVALPGPGGTNGGYFNGTPGFQCVELAERFLAVAYGFVPTNAEGATVAANYHAEYPRTTLTMNGSKGAIGHPPVAGDVISFSLSRSFGFDDGHVAIVVRSKVNSAGNGEVVVAQQNVASSDYIYTLGVQSWRVFDPREPGNSEFQFPFAEWLHVLRTPIVHQASILLTTARSHRPKMKQPAL